MNDGSPEDHASLVAAHHARIQALLEGDLDALSKVVGEDLVFISAFGQTKTWPEVVTSIKSGALKMRRMDSADISTRIYGDVGILTFKADTVSEHVREHDPVSHRLRQTQWRLADGFATTFADPMKRRRMEW